MSDTSYGKKFEQKLREDWEKLEDSVIVRLFDVMSGFKSISNISDFIGYHYPNIFFIEAKTTQGNTFPLDRLTQYKDLLKVAGKKGVRAGAIIWFRDHKKVIYVPVLTFKKLYEDDKKSVNIKMLDTKEYNIIEIPGEAKRLFIDSDYSVLFNLPEKW